MLVQLIDGQMPELGFPSITYGKCEQPWSLMPLLYRGGAATDNRYIAQRLADGTLGEPILERLPLLKLLHECITSKIGAGGSRYTTKGYVAPMRQFYGWCDSQLKSPTSKNIETLFIGWSESLLHRQRINEEIQQRTVADSVGKLGALLREALGLESNLIMKTRVVGRKPKKRVLGTKADKQNLEKTMVYGRALLDITDGLSTKAIRGPLPINISFRSGHVIQEWSGLRRIEIIASISNPKVWKSRREKTLVTRAAYSADTSLRTRRVLVNLRIQAEMLIFIAQTGMNLSEAHKLRNGKFSYQSYHGGYQVRRVYKNRKHGEVEFDIFSEYRTIFCRYLSWRDEWFSSAKEDRLFPVETSLGRSEDVPPAFSAIAKRCAILGIPMVRARELRNTRVNWILRKSDDDALTSEMSQHKQETLLTVYDRPHHQRAVQEISRYLKETDPAIAAPGPVVCNLPEPSPDLGISKIAPQPDCANPAGCLFCTNQRDVDSLDHVWSLTSYKYLKSIELGGFRPYGGKMREEPPALLVIERVNEKLRSFAKSSKERSCWVDEASARVEEGSYHPKWDGFIRLNEATS